MSRSMVYLPAFTLAIAAVIVPQIQHATAGSLYYGPYTVSGTDDKISKSAPFYGAEIPDEDCAIEVQEDPTLPDVRTIATVPVIYAELLSNKSRAPIEPVYTKVGKKIMAEESECNDAYTDETTQWMENDERSMKQSERTSKGCVSGCDAFGAQQDEYDDTRRLQSEKVVKYMTKLGIKRRLESEANRDIEKLENFYGVKMQVKLEYLPTVCVHSMAPWAGPFWPTFEDSINVIWRKSDPSPAEKYATAFNLDVMAFMNNVSVHNGIYSQKKRPVCENHKTCKSLRNRSKCGIRPGETSGYCIPIWFGICHAWAPAAILEPEPNCPVTHNGVTFQPLDLKGLITSVYDGAGVATVFTGIRYKGRGNATDPYGRYIDVAQRDINPALFHIAATNLLGLLNATFIVDVDASAEVWNQPVRGFKVFEQTVMSPEEAAQSFYGLASYPWNVAADRIVYIKSRLSWIAETYLDGGLVASGRINKFTTGRTYHYLLELDTDGNIVGGEWVYNSTKHHIDFIWIPKAKPHISTITSIGLSYANVSMLLRKSAACSNEDPGPEPEVSGSTHASADESTEDTSDLTENAPDLTEDAPSLTEDAPDLTESIPGLTEDTPDLDENVSVTTAPFNDSLLLDHFSEPRESLAQTPSTWMTAYNDAISRRHDN
ncbi:hypothetical protein CCR75_009718 [Bremia lactucae]|uniref:Transglutaminase elicitor n=1 Tax=Bremia lactucae TaxID=4779 RepID=A0A976FNY8_BRELC|nr:hypothetical protein CCR75_009718 [Bremia lactucae]